MATAGLISFLFALLSMLAQIGLYVWTQEERVVQISISCLLGFAALPVLFIGILPCLSLRKSRYESVFLLLILTLDLIL